MQFWGVPQPGWGVTRAVHAMFSLLVKRSYRFGQQAAAQPHHCNEVQAILAGTDFRVPFDTPSQVVATSYMQQTDRYTLYIHLQTAWWVGWPDDLILVADLLELLPGGIVEGQKGSTRGRVPK